MSEQGLQTTTGDRGILLRPTRASLQRFGRQAALVAVIVLVGLFLVGMGHRVGYGAADYLQLLVDGLQIGAVYALVALGFVVVYRVTGVINFAQGAFVMLGPMLTITLFGSLSGSPVFRLVVSALGAVLFVAAVGMAIHRLTLHPARKASALTRIIITVGVYISVQGIALIAWGPRPYVLPAFTTLQMVDRLVEVGSIIIQAQTFWIWGVAVAMLVLLALFFERTVVGKAMRACAVNRIAAQLMGIRVDRMATLAFGLAAVLGAVAGIVLSPATRPTYDMGLELGLKGFVAAIMGGLVSFPGAVVGGIALGILESLWGGVTLAGFKDLFAFLMLILSLLFWPQGILAGKGEGGS
ncbi:MAG: branched-chain amino acid ABC transporter permease [Armatimonadota bacterium]|nr:branched-chain amino acid ABC transporter permease [Armatimonadota bacterium]